jgi:catechol 2,3-dioxygenase-like lactoylglutathione lyase family enzyme
LFDRVTIRVAELEASERFFGLVLLPLGIERSSGGEGYAEWEEFSLAQASADQPTTQRLHIGFRAASREEVDEFWRVGCAAGYRDDGAPGPRPQYSPDYYGAFLLDPDGNSAEAVHGTGGGPPGVIDHLWIRVADLAAATRFYETAAPRTGFHKQTDTTERVRFRGRNASFSVMAGPEPTQNLHMAFSAEADATARDPDGNEVQLVDRRPLGEPSVDVGTA